MNPSPHTPATSLLTIYTARRVITMDESLPDATAVAVRGGRIVAVGHLEDMDVWRTYGDSVVDRRFERQVLMPGLIDNHIHPFLGAILMPMELLAPESWRQPEGGASPAVRTPPDYERLLVEREKAQSTRDDWFITWGYQPNLHGTYDRARLDELFPHRPVILWHRSFHETVLNTRALKALKIDRAQCDGHPHMNWERGHFWETGFRPVLAGLMPHFLRPQWYGEGLRRTAGLMQMGGITTAADMLFGAINPEYEVKALDALLHGGAAPLRVVNVFDLRGFANRAAGTQAGPPDQPIDFEAGFAAIEPWLARGSRKIWFARAGKLFADGAMFSQLMRMRPPGYIDGHEGEWLMAPEVLKTGVAAAWQRGWTVHVHVNGDGGMDAVIAALAAAQDVRPRFDHRFHVHHVGFHAQAQTARLAALGAHASVNPYYLHALGDDYARFGLGPERAAQITRCGSMARAGIRVSFHSDYMMAPPEPLALAWCAATRTTLSGKVVAPDECLTLMQALKGITIDAAWALGLEDEIGSIAAGKRADFVVLEDDPFEGGPDRLRELRVAGTVFEGQPHMLPKPVPSSLLQAKTSAPTTDRPAAERPLGKMYRAAPGCSAVSDRCDLVRLWSSWLTSAFPGEPRAA